MKDIERLRYEMFIRVREFGQKNAALFPASSFAGEQLAVLSDIIDELEAHASAQTTGMIEARSGSSSRAAARDELTRTLQAINRTVRPLARVTPGLLDKFRIPYSQSDQGLLAFARSVLVAAAPPLAAELIKRGLSANFLAELQEDIDQLDEAITGQAQSRETHVEATAAIDDLIERGMNAVSELDPLMRNTFVNDPAKLAAWMSASHIERSPRQPRPPAPGATPPAP